jgi:hypothetical protein
VSAAGPGGTGSARTGSRAHELVRLATRLIAAQAIAAGSVGLPFSRRHLPSILITLAFVAALFLLAAVVRHGGHAAWLVAISAESAFVMFGLSQFLMARYLGGTLLGIVALGALLQPSVGRAFSAGRRPAMPAADDLGGVRDGLDEAPDGPLGGHAIG